MSRKINKVQDLFLLWFLILFKEKKESDYSGCRLWQDTKAVSEGKNQVLVKTQTGFLWWNFSHMRMKTLQWWTSEEDGSLLWCFGMWFRDCECSSWLALWLALWGCMHQCIYCSPMSVWNSEATSDLPIYWHHQLNNTTYENTSPALKLEPASLSWI